MKRSLLFLALLVPAVFYFVTTARTVGQADQAILIHAMSEGRVSASATHHNLTVLVGYLFFHLLPLQEVAYRCNLVSTVFGTLTVAAFFLLGLRLTGSAVVAGFSAAFVMVGHSLWWHSTIAENYAASAFLSTLVMYFLVRFDENGHPRWLAAAGAVAGLGVFNHMQMGMWFPGILLAALAAPAASRRARVVRALRAGLWIGVGLLPFLAVFLLEVGQSRSLDHATSEAMGADFMSLFFTAGSMAMVREALSSTARIFMMQWGWPSLFWLFIAVGAVRALRGAAPRAALLAGAVAFAVNTTFFAVYPTWDKYAFLLQSILVLGFFGLVGLDHLWKTYGRRRALAAVLVAASTLFCLYPLYFFARLTDLARRSSLWRSFAVQPSGVNMVGADGAFLAEPNKRSYRSVDDFARRLFAALPPNSVLIDHVSRTYYPLTYYFQNFYRLRRDVRVLLFAPSDLLGSSARQWKDSVNAPETVDLVAQRMASRDVFLSAHLGFDDVIGPLLDRGITVTEYPLGGDWLVYQARPATDVDLKAWVEAVQAAAFSDRVPERSPAPAVIGPRQAGPLGVFVFLKKGSPPMKAHVEWTRLDGTGRVVGRDYFIPQGATLVFIRGADQRPAPGRWSAELIAFGQRLGTAEFQVE